jgi:hypothetical protein
LNGVGDILSLTSKESATDVTMKQSFQEIDNPIQSITPLQFTKGNPDAEIIFKEDLKPISMEELAPSDLFFSKKRKVIVKQVTYQRVGATTKKYKILTDGETLEEE